MEIGKIALIGNPNTGKSSLFNLLTGLRQHVGNFPGVTVERKVGIFKTASGKEIEVTDLPGTYSVFPRSNDERVVYDIVSNPKSANYPDIFIYVADAVNLERNLLLFTQLYDLHVPLIVVLTMEDTAKKQKVQVDAAAMSKALSDIPVISVNGRTGEGLSQLQEAIIHFEKGKYRKPIGQMSIPELDEQPELHAADAENRFQFIKGITPLIISDKRGNKDDSFSHRLDKVLVHPISGYGIFLILLMLVFQVIFYIAAYPMDWIDHGFMELSYWAKSLLPTGAFSDMISEGIIPGIGGVLVFIPQIALLFFFLAILEETGYMSRVVFIMDKLVRPFGLNGKSVVPLMSSAACAIPGIMSARNISSWKDRLITIMVAPLMSCSARIPVYTLLIALVIPNIKILGFLNLKGVVLFGLYALGLFSALAVSFVLKFLIKSAEPGYLIMEMPTYKWPRWNQVFIHLWEKVRVFVFDAGKVILAISIVLWAMASYGPSDRMEKAIASVAPVDESINRSVEVYEKEVNAVKLENSFIGILGHAIEPVIRPLGYDWKIGIALITSFAAREVFVGSMATIYSVGEDFEEDNTMLERLKTERNSRTGELTYNLASGMSLMIFYVYAMQCMATFAVVKRETNSWKWPLIQMTYMGVLAYIASFIVYSILK
jgi:ferrous iron transport protein B